MEECVERVAGLSDADMLRRFILPGQPFILTGGTEDWPARDWSLEALEGRYGDVPVLVAHTDDGRLRTSKGKGVAQIELPLGEFLRRLRSGERHLYLISPVEERLPGLLRDLRPPAVQARATWRSTRIWLGPSGTCSPLHQDFPDNLYVQIFGRKRVILIDRRDTGSVYRHPPWSGLPNFSRVDAEAPTDPRFPRFARVAKTVCVVEPGEMLYIPRLWWHHVRALETSLSLNLWFASGWRGMVARGLQAYARARGLRR